MCGCVHALLCASVACVAQELDFEALEHATVYEDGFTAESPTVQYFWEVVHSFSQVRAWCLCRTSSVAVGDTMAARRRLPMQDDRKKVLAFATGSDRAPIKGLGSLRFVISRMGPDSDLYVLAW